MTLYDELADAVKSASKGGKASGRYLFSYDDDIASDCIISVTANAGLCENLQVPHGLEMKFSVDKGRKILIYDGNSTRPILAGCFLHLYAKRNGLKIVGTKYNNDVVKYWLNVYKGIEVRYF